MRTVPPAAAQPPSRSQLTDADEPRRPHPTGTGCTRPRPYAADARAGRAPARPASALSRRSAKRVCTNTETDCLARRSTTECSSLSGGAIELSKPWASGESRPSASTTNGIIGVFGDFAAGYFDRFVRTMSAAAAPSSPARLVRFWAEVVPAEVT